LEIEWRISSSTVHHDQIGATLANVMPQAADGVGQHEVHVGAGVLGLVEKPEQVLKSAFLDFIVGRAIAGEHVHARHEQVTLQPHGAVDLPHERLELAKIGAGPRDEQDFFGGRVLDGLHHETFLKILPKSGRFL
jgi:hypothetical protein